MKNTVSEHRVHSCSGIPPSASEGCADGGFLFLGIGFAFKTGEMSVRLTWFICLRERYLFIRG